MPRNHAIFKKSLKNLPSGVCHGTQECRHQLSNINRNFDDYKYDSDREGPGIIPIHTECLKFILQRIEKCTDKVENILDICDLASDSKRICENCHPEIKQKISNLQTHLYSDSNAKMIFMHASCLAGLLEYLGEVYA